MNAKSPEITGSEFQSAGEADGGSTKQFDFVHLHVHSAFSLLESSLPLKRVLDLAVNDQQPALAVTDRNNLFGALEFSEKAVDVGIQPIVGCKLAVDLGDGQDPKPRHGQINYPYVVLLACSEEGFSNLTKLVSAAHIDTADGDHPQPRPVEWVLDY